MPRRMALQMGTVATKSSRQKSAPPEDLPAMQLSGLPVLRRLRTPSPLSLRVLEESLTDLREANALFTSDGLLGLSERINSG